MSVIRFTYPSDGPFGRTPRDFEIGAADSGGRAATSVVVYTRARNGAGDLTGGPPSPTTYLVASDGVAAIDLADDEKVLIRDYLTRSAPGEAPTAQHGRKVSLEGVVSVAVV